MTPLAVGIICTLGGGVFTLLGVAIGGRINAATAIDVAEVERRHREATQERSELGKRVKGCEDALNRLERTVAGMASIVRLLDPRLARSWLGDRNDDG